MQRRWHVYGYESCLSAARNQYSTIWFSNLKVYPIIGQLLGLYFNTSRKHRPHKWKTRRHYRPTVYSY